jgi:aminoglycoside phosphotransferase (APT) family kinase protein
MEISMSELDQYNNLLDRANRAVHAAMGESCTVTALENWGGGAHNNGYQLHLTDTSRLFWKVEKETIFPRTRLGQVENEVTGLRLAAQAGVNCPRVIGYDFTGQVAGFRYLLAEFVDGELLGEVWPSLDEAEQTRLWNQFQDEAGKLKRIQSSVFGNIYPGGPIGQHTSLNAMMTASSNLMLEDAQTLGEYSAEDLAIIRQAHARALPLFQYRGPAAFVHQDLHIFNVFAERRNGRVEVGKLFDFGMCSYHAPYVLHFNEKAFDGQEASIAAQYGVTEDELHAFELVSKLEFINFLTSFHWRANETYGYIEMSREYLEMCQKVA